MLIGSVLGGWLGTRFSSRAVIFLLAIALLISPVAALLSAPIGGFALLISFTMTGLVGATYGPGAFNWLVAYAPIEERGLYNGISNTFGIFALAVPLAGGFLLQLTSYNVLFVAAFVISVVAGLMTLTIPLPPTSDLTE
jgi:MFS family permease